MKLGVILESKDPETVWNALRFGVAGLEAGHTIHLFLMGGGVEITSVGNARYDVSSELTRFESAGGTVHRACLWHLPQEPSANEFRRLPRWHHDRLCRFGRLGGQDRHVLKKISKSRCA